MEINTTLDSTTMVELIKLVPSLLWILLALIIFLYFKDTLRENILPYMGSIKGFGVEVTIAREQMDRSFKKWNIQADDKDRDLVLARAKRIASLLNGAKVLWLDDEPGKLIDERLLFGQLGMSVDFFDKFSEELMTKLTKNPYNLVISDMKYLNPDGIKVKNSLLDEMVKRKIDIPLIYYVGNYDRERGVPANAFGMTDRPDQLLHLVFDVIERKKS
jgi:hypothetical protein